MLNSIKFGVNIAKIWYFQGRDPATNNSIKIGQLSCDNPNKAPDIDVHKKDDLNTKNFNVQFVTQNETHVNIPTLHRITQMKFGSQNWFGS